MESRCRLCAELYHNSIQILEDTRFSSMLNQLFHVEVSLEDRLPLTVCQDCYQSVERTWQFKQQVEKAQALLTELVNTVEALSTEIIHNGVSEIPIFEEESKYDPRNNGIELNLQNDNLLQDPNEKLANVEQVQTVSAKKINKVIKKTKGNGTIRKSKSTTPEGFNEIDFINPDGSIVPKPGITGWDSFQWSCLECNIVFSISDELREHFASVHNSTVRYPCVDCSKVYSKYIIYISHVKCHRPHLEYCCDICYKWYRTTKEISVHRKSHYEERPYHCSMCGKQFRVHSVLIAHTRSHLPDEIKNCFQCDECPKKFGTKPNLIAHKRIHLGVREYTCDQCGKSFVQKGNLDNHLKIHNAARPYDCGVCGNSFKTIVRLRKHSMVHSGLKPYQCDVCGRQFRERSTLKEHHRIHTGAMPYTCEFCGKSFRFKGVLTTHRRQHTGERPYSCNECQHHFTNWPNYNKHMKRRHGINTSVNCRTRQDIPPTGRPHRNPPGSVLAPPQQTVHVEPPTVLTPLEEYSEAPAPTFYPVLGLYGISDDLLQQRV